MQNVVEQKARLEQKKNRLIAEETRLKLKERKMRTRHLIERLVSKKIIQISEESTPV